MARVKFYTMTHRGKDAQLKLVSGYNYVDISTYQIKGYGWYIIDTLTGMSLGAENTKRDVEANIDSYREKLKSFRDNYPDKYKSYKDLYNDKLNEIL